MPTGQPAPPVFEQIFRNARFAQGGNALFEGKVQGNPRPTISWTRQGRPINDSNKYQLKYNPTTGDVSLMISRIGPGDEGEYTCLAKNQYGEAICTVYIQPEAAYLQQQQQQQGMQRRMMGQQQSMQFRQDMSSVTDSAGHTTTSSTVDRQYQTTPFGQQQTEEFRVDTFEYRLIRETEFRESLTRRYAGETETETEVETETESRQPGPLSPPQIQTKPRATKVAQGGDATFQARLTGNPKPKVTWFRNGVRVRPGPRAAVSHVNSVATLKLRAVQPDDSAHYTMLAENAAGCVVSSAFLAVEPAAVSEAMRQSVTTQRTEKSSVSQTEESTEDKALAPSFLRVPTDKETQEGKMVRLECRTSGKPSPEVSWYINGMPVTNDATHKIMVNEAGSHVLMITNVSRRDSGVVTCVAKNKYGQSEFQVNLNVLEKEQVIAPKFVERFQTVHVRPGEPVSLSCRAVGAPTPRITWQKDGAPIDSSPSLRIVTDGGASMLDIPCVRPEDGAWYQCTAQNAAGSTATRAKLYVETGPAAPAGEPWRLQLPKPTKVIEPEAPLAPEIIHLKHVERSRPKPQRPEQERPIQPPQFTHPLRDVRVSEGDRVLLEAKVVPLGDPTMRIEWYIDGQPLPASSRATLTDKFGYVSLSLLSVVQSDAGTYTCRAVNQGGSADSTCTVSVGPRSAIETASQHPESLQPIQQLEDTSRYVRSVSTEEHSVRPSFVRELRDVAGVYEGGYAHFEAQIQPVSDPYMRIEWFKDGRPITASSRISTINNFGYLALNINQLRPEDSGVYTARATNKAGEASSQAQLQVSVKASVTGDLGIPEQQKYIQSVEQLEAYKQSIQQQVTSELEEKTVPPKFTQPIRDAPSVPENGTAHFEARLEPMGDSTMMIRWLKDGRPLEASSRMTTFFNFGYVSLTIKQVTVFDSGVYTCVAANAAGQAQCQAKLHCVGKKDIDTESHMESMQKIQYLEDSSRYQRLVEEDVTVTKMSPKFLSPIKGTNVIREDQKAHFETRLEPQNDPTMKTEWFHNGQPLTPANRIQTFLNFGYVALDISAVKPEDAGTYTLVAKNALGEARAQTQMKVEARSAIDTSSIHRTVVEKTDRMERSKFQEPHYDVGDYCKSKPKFTEPLRDPQPQPEGRGVHLECRLEPLNDPTMRVEWFQNGRPVTIGSRFRTYCEFGFVALDVLDLTAADAGEYTVRATNQLGSAHTSAMVRVLSRADIDTETQHESALDQIQYLEDSARYSRQITVDAAVDQVPTFTKPLRNIETVEGTNVHLECRLQPVGDNSMKVEWFVNDQPLKIGHRFRPAYDFDYVALDLLSVYPADSGMYTCRATNRLGQAVTSASVRVIAKKDLYTDHPASLERIQYIEDSTRYQRKEWADEMVQIKPKFLTQLKHLENLKENQTAHFEAKLEPVADANLRVEWLKDGKPITVGHRHRPLHDFGYVALDIVGLIEEDNGVYTCRATNNLGCDETSAILRCTSSTKILTSTQHEAGLEQLQHLEDRSRHSRSETSDEVTTQAPVFTTSLNSVTIKEGQRAHFESRLIPVSDATMNVQWFHNGRPVKAGSRFMETNNFGFVALDIMYAYPEDQGTYTCKATNALGEAVTQATLTCISKSAIDKGTLHEQALDKLRYLEQKHQPTPSAEEGTSQAPVFTQPIRDARLAEGQPLHLEARLIPVGDANLRVEWFKNGVPLQPANRISTLHDFGFVALDMKYTQEDDSGTYTCRATNDLGQAVTSATAVIQSKESLLLETQHAASLEKLRQLEGRTFTKTEIEETVVTEKPRFVTNLTGATSLVEGQSAHMEARIEPYPDGDMKVEWFHNGKAVATGHRYRTVNDFGFIALDVLSAYPEDSGEYTAKITNRLGTASSSINIKVQPRAALIQETQHPAAMEKISYLESEKRRAAPEEAAAPERPVFGRPLRNCSLAEGQSAHLEATLTPVNDATMKVEWFYNGRPIPQGHRFRTTYDFGYVALDILYTYPEDSGTYMCKATNAAGEAVTTCDVTVEGKQGLCLDTLDAARLEKIRSLESAEAPRREEAPLEMQKPVFITPLNNLENLREGEHAHLECRLEPINDPKLKVEWFVNGKEIRTGHRFRTTHDFGYVALDILYGYPEDSGTYMCKATNELGEAVNTCTIRVNARRSIYLDTQHPEGWQKIRDLESREPERVVEAEAPQEKPRFVQELRGPTQLAEGGVAHMEGRIEPLHDSNLRVEFFHNGKPLQSASRFHVTFDFGYVSLDIKGLVEEDAGEYTCRAVNNVGEATSSLTIQVLDKEKIILASQRPEGLEAIRQLEQRAPETRPEEVATYQKPMFTHPLQSVDRVDEGQAVHLEARLIPVGDPKLRVEWFRNEQPLQFGSRFKPTHDFGYVALDIAGVRPEDEGVYSCRATNELGEAVTTASVRIRSEASIVLDTQHPESIPKLAALEQKAPSAPAPADQQFEKPVFTMPLTGPADLIEGQHAHFEARCVPVGDPNLKFEWFSNGVELKLGSRIKETHDFGFVTLDIMSVIPEDAGMYMCRAVNLAGEAVTSTSLRVHDRSSILGDAIHASAWDKIQMKEAEMNRVPEMYVEERPQQPPVFTTHLQSYDHLTEQQSVHLEATVEPKTDPNLRVEWSKNGVPLMTGARLRSTFDFGLVTLDIMSLRGDDSGIYTCRAVNLMGEAVSTCTLKVEDKHWLLSQSQRPEALSAIAQLELGHGPAEPPSPEIVFELPVFVSHLNNVECDESDRAHFECRVEPAKDPTLKIEWFLNGKPMKTGSRFTSQYDFGFVTLDITGTQSDDSGLLVCKATNQKGSAQTSGTLKVRSKADIMLDTVHPAGGRGLEKVEEVDAALAGKPAPDGTPEKPFPKPWFIVPLQPSFELGETEPLRLECNVEPKEDPKLEIEWLFNGKLLAHGSRFRVSNDFGFVQLDLADVYPRDQGIYTCRAWNQAGEAFTTTTVTCKGKASLIDWTQHPKGEMGLEAIQELEEARKRGEGPPLTDEEGHPPVFTSQCENLSDLSEGDIAHFEATLTPIGDQTMKVEWFYNNKPLDASHRIRTVHAFSMVVLEILGTRIDDSGVYKCRATNKWGQAEIEVTLECVEKESGQKPRFVTQIQNVDNLKDGDSAHFECTLVPVGDPTMKVEWFHDGKPLRHSSRIKCVSDFGFVVMDIAYTQNEDSGEYTCRATNKYGSDSTTASLRCQGKGGVFVDSLQPQALRRITELEMTPEVAGAPPAPGAEAPKFTKHIAEIANMVEGHSAHFEARLTPVHDPDLTVEWYRNGTKLPTGHRFRTFHDFGIVILDILYCYEEDSGLYECRAVNKVGSDVTKAELKCVSKESLVLTPQIPKEMSGGLEKIQTLEDAARLTREQHEEVTTRVAPRFTVPFNNIDDLREGENAHFEARLTPVDDPKLKTEWYHNSKPMKASSRFRTFCDFGFVILEISPVYPEDSGEYTCRAYNEVGEATSTAVMKCSGKRNIILESQLPTGMDTMQKIAELEGLGVKPVMPGESEEGAAPQFLTQPADISLVENQLAHFECRLTPVGDPTMRVEWYHNGKPLSAGSRVRTINDFGYVILEIGGIYQRDAGLYTCKAINRHGEASVSCSLTVKGRQGVVLEPQMPHGMEGIRKLEESMYRSEQAPEEDDRPRPPRFVTELQSQEGLFEGQPAHFDCRVEPVGDPSMRIEWFHNGRSIDMGSRVHFLDDFGFIVLDLDWTFPRDSGEYVCRATNKWGTATTKATLICKAKRDVVLDSQLPKGLSGDRLRTLEEGPKMGEPLPPEADAEPPRFIKEIDNVDVGEGETAFFDCRVEPKHDPYLRVEWYRNGVQVQTGHRFRTTFDFGYASLQILGVYPEDGGEYTCRAVNRAGQATCKSALTCRAISSVIMLTQVPKGMKRSDYLMQMEATLKKYTSEIHLTEDDIYDADRKQPPRFVTQIQDKMDLVEMEQTKFECQLAPVGDPNMKVEWFFNGRPLPYKNRFTPIYDFGYVAMNFGWVYPEDSGEYLCRATNLYGMDETRATIKTKGKPGIVYDSQLPAGMDSVKKIREMESLWNRAPDAPLEEERPREAPVFVTKPEPVTVNEGDWARFCCRVTGHPRPRVMWLINGHTIVNGTRYKLTYDGMWRLDIPKTRQYDNGKIEVVARNSAGEAYCSCEIKINARQDDYRAVLKNSPKRHDEDSPSYRKPDWVIQMEETKAAIRARQQPPKFTTELTNQRAKENASEVEFKCVVTGQPRPEVTLFHNGQRLSLSRFVRILYVDDRVSLVLCDVTPDMAGEYTVRATNPAGEATTTATLEVQELSDEEREELKRERDEAVEKRKKREQERIRRMEEKKRIQEETARKIREKKEFLKPIKIKKVQPTIEEQAALETEQTTSESQPESLVERPSEKATARRKLSTLEAFTQQEITVDMSVEEVKQFIVERETAERKLSEVQAPLVQEVTPQLVEEELKKVTADKVVAETKLAVLQSYTVQEITPQTTVDDLKAFVDERHEAEQVWNTVETLEIVQPAQQHIAEEIKHLRQERAVAEVKLDLTEGFQVQELRPELTTDQLDTFITERRDAQRRISTVESLNIQEAAPEEVVKDLTQLFTKEETSAKIKLDLLNTYSVQEVTTETTAEETKTFISERHEAEQVLSTALQSAETTEVSPAFVTSEIDHIRTEKAHALKHLQQVQPQAVQEMETLLQTTVELKKFKYVTDSATETAEQTALGKAVATKTETTVRDKKKKLKQRTASVERLPEIAPEDAEDQPTQKPKKEAARPGVIAQESVQHEQIVPAEYPETKPDQKTPTEMAESRIDILDDAVTVTEFDVQETTEKLPVRRPKKSTADQTQEIQQPILIEEQHIQDVSEDFEEQMAPTEKGRPDVSPLELSKAESTEPRIDTKEELPAEKPKKKKKPKTDQTPTEEPTEEIIEHEKPEEKDDVEHDEKEEKPKRKKPRRPKTRPKDDLVTATPERSEELPEEETKDEKASDLEQAPAKRTAKPLAVGQEDTDVVYPEETEEIIPRPTIKDSAKQLHEEDTLVLATEERKPKMEKVEETVTIETKRIKKPKAKKVPTEEEESGDRPEDVEEDVVVSIPRKKPSKPSEESEETTTLTLRKPAHEQEVSVELPQAPVSEGDEAEVAEEFIISRPMGGTAEELPDIGTADTTDETVQETIISLRTKPKPETPDEQISFKVPEQKETEPEEAKEFEPSKPKKVKGKKKRDDRKEIEVTETIPDESIQELTVEGAVHEKAKEKEATETMEQVTDATPETQKEETPEDVPEDKTIRLKRRPKDRKESSPEETEVEVTLPDERRPSDEADVPSVTVKKTKKKKRPDDTEQTEEVITLERRPVLRKTEDEGESIIVDSEVTVRRRSIDKGVTEETVEDQDVTLEFKLEEVPGETVIPQSVTEDIPEVTQQITVGKKGKKPKKRVEPADQDLPEERPQETTDVPHKLKPEEELPTESVPTPEGPDQDVSIKRKPKKDREIPSEEVSATAEIPDTEEIPTKDDTQADAVTWRKPKDKKKKKKRDVTEETEEVITLQRQPVLRKTEEEIESVVVDSEVTVRRKSIEKPVEEEVPEDQDTAAEFTVQPTIGKATVSEVEGPESGEVSETVTVDKKDKPKKRRPKDIDTEAPEEKEEAPVAPDEDKPDEVSIKRVKKKPTVTEEPDAEVTLKKKKPKKTVPDDTAADATVSRTMTIKRPDDEVEAEVTLAEDQDAEFVVPKTRKAKRPEDEGEVQDESAEADVVIRKVIDEEIIQEVIEETVDVVEETPKKRKKKTRRIQEETEDIPELLQPVEEKPDKLLPRGEEEEQQLKPVDETDQTLPLKKPKKKRPEPTESEEEITIKRRGPSEDDQVQEDVTVRKPEEDTDDVEQAFIMKRPKKKPVKADDVEEEITLTRKKPAPSTDISEEVATSSQITVKRFDETVEEHYEEQDTEFEFRPKDRAPTGDSEQPEDEAAEARIQIKKPRDEHPDKLQRPKKHIPYASMEDEDEVRIQLSKDADTQETIETVYFHDMPSVADDLSEDFEVALPRRKKPEYKVEDVETEFGVKVIRKKQESRVEAAEGSHAVRQSFKMKLRQDSMGARPGSPGSPVQEEFDFRPTPAPESAAPVWSEDSEDASLRLQLRPKRPVAEETVPLDVSEGDVFYAVSTYVAESEETMHLVEGERVYVLECHNSDWWFVRKHLTEEAGWVPASYLKNEDEYNAYVQRKLSDKIGKLPVFEAPKTGQKPKAPRFTEKLRSVHVVDGSVVQLECRVEGVPRPTITWFRQTAIIKPSPDFQMFYDDDNVATLIIKEVFPEDAGTFTCVAKNEAGFSSCSAELVVEAPLSDHGSDVVCTSRRSLSRESSLCDILEGIPPTFSQRPKTRTVQEGDDVELECRLVAVPEPEVQWLLNGRPLKPSKRVAVTVQSDMHMYCHFVRIQGARKKDEGLYEIVAINREGEATNTIALAVEERGEKQPPALVQPLEPLIVPENSRATFVARVSGKPQPRATWFTGKHPLTAEMLANSDVTVTQEGDVYSLHIPRAHRSDAGEYTLLAENASGMAKTTATLVVQESQLEPPMFIERFTDLRVGEKEPIRLTAKVVGNPRPEVTWYRNGKKLKTGKNTSITHVGEETTLEVRESRVEKDAGEYKCVAINANGKATHQAQVDIDADVVRFVKDLEDFDIEERSTVALECQTSQDVNVIWKRGSKVIESSKRHEISHVGKTHRLIVHDVVMEDAGQYSCTTDGAETLCQVTVKEGGAYFVEKLTDVEVKETETATLSVAVSSPTARVVWHKDGAAISEDDTQYEFISDGVSRRLVLRSASVHEEGEYTCSLDDQECTCEVTVVELPPVLTKKMSDTTVTRGERAVFEVALTKGDALVQWYCNDKEIKFSEHVQLGIDGKRQRLMVYQTTSEDAGTYSCRIGGETSSAKLTVEEPTVEFVARLPEKVEAPKDTTASFTVELSDASVPVTWLKNGEPITESDSCTLLVDGARRTLLLREVQAGDDRTEISCVAGNVKCSSKLRVTVVQMQPKIREDLLQTEYLVRRGEDVKITVPFRAAPPPKAEWHHNRKTIKKSRKYLPTINESEASITVRQVEDADCGTYTLKLGNEVGDIFVNISLKIMETPSKPGRPEPVQVTDTSVTLHWTPPQTDGCSPITSYTIEYQMKLQKTWTKYEETRVVKETTRIVTSLTQNTEYRFRVYALNEIGASEPSDASDFIKVTQPVSPERPTVVEDLKDTVAGLNERLTLRCVITGVPPPEIRWTRNGKPVKTRKVSYEQHVATLTIEETTEKSAGTYTCHASNPAGEVETSCMVKIQEPPALEYDRSLKDQRLEVDATWTITVRTSGIPRPSLQWFKGDEPLAPSSRLSIATDAASTSISLRQLAREDTGTYRLVATNDVRSVTEEFTLRVLDYSRRTMSRTRSSSPEMIDKPSRPEGPLVARVAEKEAVTLDWKPPADDGGCEIAGYFIEKFDTKKQIWMKVADIVGDILTYSVQDLLEGHEYFFRVYAFNVLGSSEPLETSEAVLVKKPFALPSAPLGPFEVASMGDTSLTLSWQEPETDGGAPIVEYLVERRNVGKKAWQKVGTTDSETLKIDVTGLKKNMQYNFRVTARNAVGAGPPLAPEDAITVGKRLTPPSPPTQLTVSDVTSRSVTLQWAPPTNMGGANLTGYIIERQAAGDSRWEKVVTLDSSVTLYCVSNLKEKSSLFFRVSAENPIGAGEPADTDLVSLKTHAMPPSPPTAPLEMRSTGPNSLLVEWGIPESDGGAPLEGYHVAIRDARRTMWIQVGTVGAEVTRLQIKELHEGHEYYVRIFAKNEVGMSDPLESEDTVRVVRPADYLEAETVEGADLDRTPSLSATTETSSWMREAGMDADIRSYSRLALLRRDEYFFRIWYYSQELFK